MSKTVKDRNVFHFADNLFPRPRIFISLERALSLFHNCRMAVTGMATNAKSISASQDLFRQSFQNTRLIAYRRSETAFDQPIPREAWDFSFLLSNELEWKYLQCRSYENACGDAWRFIVEENHFFEFLNNYADQLTAKRTRSTKGYRWDEYYAEVERFIEQNGLPRPIAVLNRHMAAWCARVWLKEPADSTIKSRTKRAIRRSPWAE